MSFDLFMRQVSAISSVSGAMTGHVSASRTRIGAGHSSQQTLGASLLLGDALRLMALLEDMRETAFEEIDQLQMLDVGNANSLLYMKEDMSQATLDVQVLESMVAGLTSALDVVRHEIGQVAGLLQEVTNLAQSAEQGGIYDQARDTLQNEVLPELYRMRDDIELLLERAVAALEAKRAEVWYVETVFKFVLPLNRRLKLRRRVTQADEEGLLREDLPAEQLASLRALVTRALRRRRTVPNEALRERLKRFLEVTAPAVDQKV